MKYVIDIEKFMMSVDPDWREKQEKKKLRELRKQKLNKICSNKEIK